jgi:hypothetical protein
MKTLVIGDIHGCYIELQELLEKAGLSTEDEIIALGDIVDRGPETPQVLEFFREQPKARSLMGNHERKHVRAARGEVKLSLSQLITRAQFGEAYPAALAWMGAFPTYLELPEAILVHGYLEPGVLLTAQLDPVLCGTMGGDRHLRSHYDRPWYELYAGEKPVIAGHYDYSRNGQPMIYQNRIYGLDTSCVHGKTLTGLILPDFRIVTIPSRGNHWRQDHGQYRHLVAPARPAVKPPIRSKGTAVWDEAALQDLQAILGYVDRTNAQVLAHLNKQPEYPDLTPRQQAKAYAAVIGDTPVIMLLHLARRGEISFERAQKLFHPHDAAAMRAKLGE